MNLKANCPQKQLWHGQMAAWAGSGGGFGANGDSVLKPFSDSDGKITPGA